MIPIIAIIGRPNTGKSTLFNRLVGSRIAIISKVSGTTRDRIYQFGEINEYKVLFVDTGGMQYGEKDNIESAVHDQAELAIEEADVIVFLVDGSSAATSDDLAVVNILRKSGKSVILAANKSDSGKFSENFPEYYKFGFKDFVQLSAIHSRGIDELEEKIVKIFKSKKIAPIVETAKTSAQINIAILGRPNVGKSSLVNALLGEKRAIVSEIPGTTRDSLDTQIEYKNQTYNLIDTAGIRRAGKRKYFMEKLSVLRGLKALERSDIAVLVIDGSQKVSHQDCNIAGEIVEEKKGLILAVNKTDLFESKDEEEKYLWSVKANFDFLAWAPVIFISAKTGRNIRQIFDLASQIYAERRKQIPQKELEEFLMDIILEHPSGIMRKKPFESAKQTNIDPPEITIITRDPEKFNFSYRRYIENSIRKRYTFTGTAIRIIFKKIS